VQAREVNRAFAQSRYRNWAYRHPPQHSLTVSGVPMPNSAHGKIEICALFNYIPGTIFTKNQPRK